MSTFFCSCLQFSVLTRFVCRICLHFGPVSAEFFADKVCLQDLSAFWPIFGGFSAESGVQVTPGGKATLTFGRPAGLQEASWPPGKKSAPFPLCMGSHPTRCTAGCSRKKSWPPAGGRLPWPLAESIEERSMGKSIEDVLVVSAKKGKKNKRTLAAPTCPSSQKKAGLRRPPAASGGL